jgi:hypothetical protein
MTGRGEGKGRLPVVAGYFATPLLRPLNYFAYNSSRFIVHFARLQLWPLAWQIDSG